MPLPEARTGREWLKVEPDAQYGIGYVDAQFEVPYDFPPALEMVKIAAAPTVAKTIDHFTRLSKWKLYDKLPIQYLMSHLPSQAEIDGFNYALAKGLPVEAIASPLTAFKPIIVLKARIWFIRPLDRINMDAAMEHRGEEVGLAETLPAEYTDFLKETTNVDAD